MSVKTASRHLNPPRRTVQTKLSRSSSQNGTANSHINPLQMQQYFGNRGAQILLSEQGASNPVQAKLAIGAPDDPYEREADRVADEVVREDNNTLLAAYTNDLWTLSQLPFSLQRKCSHCEGEKIHQKEGERNSSIPLTAIRQQTGAPPLQLNHGSDNKASHNLPIRVQGLGGQGQPLPQTVRSYFEHRMGNDFSSVRIHTSQQASESAKIIGARAYTSGNSIVFSKGRYNPNSPEGKHLLAHELTHVVQQSEGYQRIQKQAVSTTSAPVPRQDVVYIMGRDTMGKDKFYSLATRFFRARFPNAVFVNNQRSLRGLLTHLTRTFTNPLGTIYIVSHANEDGTLAFKLDSNDATDRMTVVELRNALNPQSGSSSLPTVGNQVDDQTRIEIKGCDLGRNQDILELLDKAFNGMGTVSAPTHEQVYGYDPGSARDGTTSAMNEHMQTFEQSLPELPPKATPVDRNLRGDDRIAARREFEATKRVRAVAQQARQRAISAEKRRYRSEARRLGEIAGTYEAISGPMFQHKGTDLFTADGLRPQVAALYGHLSKAQQKKLISRLIRPDKRGKKQAHKQGVYRQQGQRQYRYENHFRYFIPQNYSQARREYSKKFRSHQFVPTSVKISRDISANGETTFIYNFEGTKKNNPYFMQFKETIPSNQSLIENAKAVVNNKDKFAWSITENQHANGRLIKTVIRERVVCYLHHGSLNASPGDHFLPPESDRRFFAESNFMPPPP